MRSFLVVDFGSTYTKLNLSDLDKPCLLAQSKGKTTIESSILFGFQEAFQCLQQYYPISLNEISPGNKSLLFCRRRFGNGCDWISSELDFRCC